MKFQESEIKKWAGLFINKYSPFEIFIRKSEINEN